MRGIFVTNPKYYRDDSKTTKIPRSNILDMIESGSMV